MGEERLRAGGPDPVSGMAKTGGGRPVVLLAGSDAAYLDLLEDLLAAEGFRTSRTAAQDVAGAARCVRADLVLVDGAAGPQEVWRRLRRDPAMRHTPLVVLAGRDGATAPAGPGGIVAGLRLALLARERAGAVPPEDGVLRHGEIEMDLDAHRVRRAGREIHLTPIEYRLLGHLLRHPERVFTREQLARAAWPRTAYVSGRTVDVHVGRLRRALGTPQHNHPIRTVRAVGYALTTTDNTTVS